jgi:tetratricopeptide (TPR) repeat protein
VPAAPAVDVDELRNEVMEAYLLHRKQDAFDLLGIDHEATREQVDDAFLAFCEKYAPWKMSQPGLESLTEKARDLFIAGGRAFGELCNPETRNSLIARRNSAFKEKLVPEDARNAFAIKSNLLDSETQFKKGIELMKAGNYADAIEQLQFAYDCEPQNSEYRAELAFCKYRKDPQIEKDNSIQELRETLRIEPDCGIALYYAGMIFGEDGDFANAEPFLQRAIKLMKPDRRPIDALRQFKAAERDKPKKKRLFF